MSKKIILNEEIITPAFFSRDTLTVAKDLLGKVIVRKDGDIIKKGMIVETEAYKQEDPACHAYRGKTKRSATLFKASGICYVYFIYGMYHCLNFVTEKEGYGSGVLIRALEPVKNISNTNGPGKLCKELNINKTHNETEICNPDSELYVINGKHISEKNIVITTRIGIKQAMDYPWRFYIKDNKYVSKF